MTVLKNLQNQLAGCIRYYESIFNGRTVDRIIFVGGVARNRLLCQLIAQRLALPAQLGDPLAMVGGNGQPGAGIALDRREPQPAWTVAFGLSLTGSCEQDNDN